MESAPEIPSDLGNRVGSCASRSFLVPDRRVVSSVSAEQGISPRAKRTRRMGSLRGRGCWELFRWRLVELLDFAWVACGKGAPGSGPDIWSGDAGPGPGCLPL